MAQVEIFSAEVCPYAHRTRLALLEKGVDFTLTEIDLKHKPAWFKDVSPYGKVPSVRVGKDIVYESAIINEYIDEVFPNPPMMPKDAGRRALARIWIDFCNTRLNVTTHGLLRALDSETQVRLRTELDGHLRFMETEGFAKMGPGPYWMVEGVTLVDVAYYPSFERFCNIEHYRDYLIPEDCVRLKAWIAGMRERPSVKSIANPADFYIKRAAAYALPQKAAA
ncbi:MAG: glutathione S-transferase family protein [Alphaproteobacteria bacterium]|nr:glutathione S-transferase family protein [Alphaproteobacteria bacterium]